MTAKILCVDDEPNILAGYQRSLRKQFEIEIATGGAEALAKIAQDGPYAVLVTDMRMPGMNGVEFLKRARAAAPDAVRIMLTGNADQQTAAEAVNEGHVFQFLTKPCPPESLAEALTEALEHNRLLTAEKRLLEKTLGGAIRMLMEILAVIDPDLFGRAQTLRQNMRALATAMSLDGTLTSEENDWTLELGALLSQVGAVAVPQSLSHRVRQHLPLTETEMKILQRVPETGYTLLHNIPRLEGVAQIVRYQHHSFAGPGSPCGQQIPIGARMLKVLLDLAEIEARNVSRPGAFKTLQRHPDRYDPVVLTAASACLGTAVPGEARVPSVPLSLQMLKHGLILAEDIKAKDGKILVGAGRRLTETLIQKLHNDAELTGIEEPILVQSAA